jgi:hypothetical protein
MDDPNDPYSRENLSWNWSRGRADWNWSRGRADMAALQRPAWAAPSLATGTAAEAQ